MLGMKSEMRATRSVVGPAADGATEGATDAGATDGAGGALADGVAA